MPTTSRGRTPRKGSHRPQRVQRPRGSHALSEYLVSGFHDGFSFLRKVEGILGGIAVLDWPPRRGVRVAEGTRLEIAYLPKGGSRVRIPPCSLPWAAATLRIRPRPAPGNRSCYPEIACPWLSRTGSGTPPDR